MAKELRIPNLAELFWQAKPLMLAKWRGKRIAWNRKIGPITVKQMDEIIDEIEDAMDNAVIDIREKYATPDDWIDLGRGREQVAASLRKLFPELDAPGGDSRRIRPRQRRRR